MEPTVVVAPTMEKVGETAIQVQEWKVEEILAEAGGEEH